MYTLSAAVKKEIQDVIRFTNKYFESQKAYEEACDNIWDWGSSIRAESVSFSRDDYFDSMKDSHMCLREALKKPYRREGRIIPRKYVEPSNNRTLDDLPF